MKKNQDKRMETAKLRRGAEELLKRQRPEGEVQRTELETSRLIHELEVHQIELEMQNEQLRQTRARAETLLTQYTDLYEFAPTGYFNLAADGTILAVNLTGARLVGIERAKLLNRRFTSLVSVAERPAFNDFLKRVFASRAKECCEVAVQQEGSQPLIVRFEGTSSEDGQECRAVMLDITERKRTELQTRERAKELQAFYSLSEITARNDIPLDKLYQEFANVLPESWRYTESACARIVIGDSEFRTKNFKETAWKQSAPIKVNRSEVGRIEVCYLEKKPQADQGPFLKEERVLIEELAERLGHITARKQSEVALRESESRFRELANSMPQLVWTCRPDGPCDFLSKQWLVFTGIPEAQQLGFGWLEQLHPDDRSPTVAAWEEAVTSGTDFCVEFRIRRHDGEYRWFDTRAVRLHNTAGQTVKWIGSNTDITKRKQTEQEVLRLNKDLLQKNAELEQIVYVTSHDLRTPLVNVQGFSKELSHSIAELEGYIHKSDLSKEVKGKIEPILKNDIPESLKYIKLSISKMDSLLSGLLRLSRLGRTAIEIEKIDMNYAMDEVCKTFKFELKQKRATLSVSNLPPCKGDKNQVYQLFSNLLGNALKYLDTKRKGDIKITGEKTNGSVTYCVRDNGIGIAPEHQEKIFEIFHRLNPIDGTGDGLGLTIIQRILDQLGGKVWVESELGKGSRFFVQLPC